MLLTGDTKTCHFNHGNACGGDGSKLLHYHFRASCCNERRSSSPAALPMQGCWGQWRLRRTSVCHFTWLFPWRVKTKWQQVYSVLLWKQHAIMCQSSGTLHFLWSVMFCDRVWGRRFGCVDSSSCTGHWLGESTANITALEKCFCSQAAWQKWWLVQAPAYLSQVINFSPIKTPTGMMEKVGSLTSLTQTSCGMLQCVGGWFLQSPVAENVQEWNTFPPRWLFCTGNKKGFAWRLSLEFLRHFHFGCVFSCPRHIRGHLGTLLPTPLSFFPSSHPPSIPQFPPPCLTHCHHSAFPSPGA